MDGVDLKRDFIYGSDHLAQILPQSEIADTLSLFINVGLTSVFKEIRVFFLELIFATACIIFDYDSASSLIR
ncbi:unnamed protein product [Brassica oleracea var. botrytis]